MATDMLNGWEFGVLVMTALMCALPIVAVCWSLVRVNLRLAEQNRDLMKAMLALSEKPQAASVAGAMEITDREKVSTEPIARAYMARRPAGAG
jgi:hypothetical protein